MRLWQLHDSSKTAVLVQVGVGQNVQGVAPVSTMMVGQRPYASIDLFRLLVSDDPLLPATR